MKAMILAAGFGTRLRPMTERRPKALVELAGEPLIAHLLRRLSYEGFTEVAINLHHEAAQLAEYLSCFSCGPLKLHLSFEEEILDTGGGIKKMVPLLGCSAPILVHNVDVLSDISFQSLYAFHHKHENCATLCVQDRKSKRYLVFDEQRLLSGRAWAGETEMAMVREPTGMLQCLAFNGIQIIDPQLFLRYPSDKFSSVDLYLHAAAHGERIMGWRMEGNYWRDLGKPFDLQQAEEDIRQRRYKET